jgi:hypothetical protein
MMWKNTILLIAIFVFLCTLANQINASGTGGQNSVATIKGSPWYYHGSPYFNRMQRIPTETFDDGSDDDEDEKECPDGEFWNIRGRRCVPLRCRGGNQYRDKETGQCVIGSLQQFAANNVHRQRNIWYTLTLLA